MISFSYTTFEDMEEIINLLQQLSTYKPENSDYSLLWDSFQNQDNLYGLTMKDDGKVCGFGVVLIEQKIRGSKMAHIEDIVIDSEKRGLGYGKLLINQLCEIAKNNSCYKVSLACSKSNIDFYEKCKFNVDGYSLSVFL